MVSVKGAELGGTKLKIDEKDRKIINYLIHNGRATLKEIGKEAGLSIDAAKDRIEKLKKYGVIERFTILVAPSLLGLPITAHIYIKLQNITEERYNELIKYLKNHDRISILLTMRGDYDIYMVLWAKDDVEMTRMTLDVRKKFPDIIGDWKEVTVAEVHKLEEYRF